MDGAAPYRDFLEAKVRLDRSSGFELPLEEINPALKDFNRAMVQWALKGGRRALFAKFGLHKTVCQLEIMRQLIRHRPGRPKLIIGPLNVRHEFRLDSEAFFTGDYAVDLRFVQSTRQIDDDRTIWLTNYESVREGKLDPTGFDVSLDEASILRGFGGTKTFREFMRLFEHTPSFRFVATATPSPNEYIELLAYAAFLDVMDVGQAKTRFFKRNSESADELTIHPHKTREFWLWVASWALFVSKPSDLCDCTCHHGKNSSAGDLAASKLSNGSLARYETGHGVADATVVATSSPRQTTCSPAALSVADALDPDTERSTPQPTEHGGRCSPESTGTERTTPTEGLPYATDGAPSSHSTPISATHRPERRSSGSTTTGTTNRATANGQAVKSKLETPDETSGSSIKEESNRSLHGLSGTGSATGNCTRDTRPDGPSSVCSETSCARCRFLDDGYELPPLDVRWHELPSDHSDAGAERDGQARLFRNAAIGVQDASREKRSSLQARVDKLMELRAEQPEAHRLIWHDLEDERRAIEKAIPSVVSVYGSQDAEEQSRAILGFRNGTVKELAGKPVMLGSGSNFQRHCWWEIFLGIGFKFNDFIQAIYRVQRFGQSHPVRVDIIYTEAEREVRRRLERRWRQHDEQSEVMTGIVREYGLAQVSMAAELTRSMDVERVEASGEGWRFVNNDTVDETARMPSDSVDLIVTSIPFSTQYEYSPSYRDFGHTDDDRHFFQQMDYLTAHLFRVLKPGRVAAIHVKDRIVPGGLSKLGFSTVSRFSDRTCDHFEKHGFGFLARKTVVTDVVRENNQTYRLGWTEQCKDGTRQGAGMPEYVLLFRKPPTDRSDGYADDRVVKLKKEWDSNRWINPDGYSRGRWQLDAHGFMRSGGDRLLSIEDLAGLEAKLVYRLYRKHSLSTVYDHEHHVALAEGLEEKGRLPPTFMLLPPQSWHPDVWTDITRMRTLNGEQAQKNRQMHLCPLQFDIVDRLVRQMSEPGELVFDPFAGLGTVIVRALKLGRRGLGVELSPSYFKDGVWYCKRTEAEASIPSLFDLDKVDEQDDETPPDVAAAE